mmetsp:Transcript_40710/g.121432  ORF Transcript_40710/g.121432 Transcript_40710/m.121432 type:complete len:95 (+) Transcript_40710:615-899(+)
MDAAAAAELCETLRQAVAAAHAPLTPVRVLLLEPRTVPKTTSGKIRRAECKARVLAGTLKTIPAGKWEQTAAAHNAAAAAAGATDLSETPVAEK